MSKRRTYYISSNLRFIVGPSDKNSSKNRVYFFLLKIAIYIYIAVSKSSQQRKRKRVRERMTTFVSASNLNSSAGIPTSRASGWLSSPSRREKNHYFALDFRVVENFFSVLL